MSQRGDHSGDGGDRRQFLARAGTVIGGSTLALTAAFVGVVALLNGAAGGVTNRFPFYVLAGAVVFVASLLLLDHEDVQGSTVIVATTVLGVTALVIVGLGVEGVLYAIEAPADVFGDRLVVYFVAAGLICTGLTYWGLNHWREFTGTGDPGGMGSRRR
jgi:hypothetical protein